ncbi:MAG TPA: DNA polymerase III subunit delta [Bacteroidales bacterium]|nr:DNA polymerase III subunit delta [Bacteroidales bacterium]
MLMKFSDIIGQDEIINKLIRSVKEERVSHAQVFAGPEGCGKLALAIAFAQYVSCENRQGNDSCGVCPSCIKYSKLIHPDLHFVFPVINRGSGETVCDNFISEWRDFVNKSAYFRLNSWLEQIGVKNQQGLIYASEAGEIIKKLSLKTYESDFKIMIIWIPERMHHATANKLLKLIEEPPDKTLFLLVSEEPDLILPTILSRCQFVRIPAISRQALKDHIKTQYNLDERKSDMIAHLSQGNYLRAIEFIDENESRKVNLTSFIELMRLAYKKDIPFLAEWSEEIATRGREGQKGFLSFSLSQLRENYILNITGGNDKLVFLEGSEAEFAKKFRYYINNKNISDLDKEFSSAYSHIAANGNPKIIFLDLALKVSGLIQ